MSSLDDMMISEPIREGFLDVRERIPDESERFYQFMECLGERISKDKVSAQGLVTQVEFFVRDLKWGYQLDKTIKQYPQLGGINDREVDSLKFKIPDVIYTVSHDTVFSQVVTDIIREVGNGNNLDIFNCFDKYNKDYKKAS